MLISSKLHKKSSEVSIITRSPPASFSFKGQATKHTTVKRSILGKLWSIVGKLFEDHKVDFCPLCESFDKGLMLGTSNFATQTKISVALIAGQV